MTNNMVMIGNASKNHLYVLGLRICLRKVNVPPNTRTDASGLHWPVKAWENDKWTAFKLTVKQQAQDWDKRFTLVPKNYMSHYAVGSPVLWTPTGKTAYTETTYAVNLECRVTFIFQESMAGADHVIEVANLNVDHPSFTAMANTHADGNKNTSTFRSHVHLYDSLDGEPHTFPIPDSVGTVHLIKHKSIQHEIGHALGLPHIGVTMKIPQCLAAKTQFEAGLPITNPLAKGGANSSYCYGYGAAADISKNVMGFGLQFSKVNAEPWLTPVCAETKTKPEDWEVVLDKVVPPKKIK